MRIGLALWCVSIAALIAAWTPGWDRAWAALPLMAVYGFWALLAPHSGSHTDRAGLGLTSPVPSPAGSMILDEELAALDAWAQEYEIPEVRVHGMVSGGGAPPWELAEQHPGHDDPHQLPELHCAVDHGGEPCPGYPDPTAGAPIPPAPAVAEPAGPGRDLSSVPGPAEPQSASWAEYDARARGDWPPPTRQASEDTEFRAGMAADVLAYERRQTAGAWEFTARLADWADSYLREVRAAL